MHIPAVATSEMEVLSFAEAMRRSGREADYDTDRGCMCRIFIPNTVMY